MKKTTTLLSFFLPLAAVALLSGCDSARKAFSSDKTAPDEFSVYSRPPLSLPPEYKLRPPAPGSNRPQIDSTKNLAKQAILGASVKGRQAPKPVKGSPGVQAMLKRTGGLTAEPRIRTLINEETTIISEQDQAFVDKLIFWVDQKPYQGTVVNAEKEQKRIQDAQALGKPINEGATPEIKRKRSRKGLLNF
ncbi:MAG: DUF3035 domain-containing protein [Rhodospirillales bacterium]|nr:DUF3035 domain-containing protein [Rhodospirillales bacterium]